MTNREPQPEEDRREGPRAQLVALPVRSEDPVVLGRWQQALDRWDYAFVAFTQLHLPQLYTDEVSQTFEDLYVGSYADLTQAAVAQIDALGWNHAVARLRRDEGITDDLLEWNYPAFIDRLGEAYEFVRAGGKVHLFAK